MFREKFGKSSVPKNEHPSEEELERARKAYEEADPSQLAQLSLSGEIKHTVDFDPIFHKPYTVGVHETGEYVELKKSPRQQKAIALLAKGIVPVADVASRTGYPFIQYSKIVPLEKIEKNTSEDELRAYLEFMYLVFGDMDHKKFAGIPHNYQHKNEKAVLFDFDMANLNADLRGLFAPRKTEHTVSSLEYLKDLLGQFQERITGEDGRKFIHAVLEHSHLQPSEILDVEGARSVDDVQEVLQSRTIRSLLIVENARLDLLENIETKEGLM